MASFVSSHVGFWLCCVAEFLIFCSVSGAWSLSTFVIFCAYCLTASVRRYLYWYSQTPIRVASSWRRFRAIKPWIFSVRSSEWGPWKYCLKWRLKGTSSFSRYTILCSLVIPSIPVGSNELNRTSKREASPRLMSQAPEDQS